MRTAWLVLPLLLLGAVLAYMGWIPEAGAVQPELAPDGSIVNSGETVLIGAEREARRGSLTETTDQERIEDGPLIDLRSRIVGLSYALEPGDLKGWEASVEWMALRLGADSIPDLVKLTFDSSLDLHAKVALANVLSTLRSLHGKRILGVSSRMAGRISQQVGAGVRTDNYALDVAAGRGLAAWGHDGDRARMLQWAGQGDGFGHLLLALEEAPTFEVADALAHWPTDAGFESLREWVRLQSWTLGRMDLEILSTWMIQHLVETESDKTRVDAAHILISLGDDAIDRGVTAYLEAATIQDADSLALGEVLATRMPDSPLLEKVHQYEDSWLSKSVRVHQLMLEDQRRAQGVTFGRRRLVSVFEIDLNDLRSRGDRADRVARLFGEPIHQLEAELDSQFQDTAGSRAPFLLTVIPDLDARRALPMLGLHAAEDQRPSIAKHAMRQLERLLGPDAAAEYLADMDR